MKFCIMIENKCNTFKAVQLWFTESPQYPAYVRHYLSLVTGKYLS